MAFLTSPATDPPARGVIGKYRIVKPRNASRRAESVSILERGFEWLTMGAILAHGGERSLQHSDYPLQFLARDRQRRHQREHLAERSQ